MFLKVSSVAHSSGAKNSANNRGGVSQNFLVTEKIREEAFGCFGNKALSKKNYAKGGITTFVENLLSHSAKKNRSSF